jgi:NADH dehydrogenase
MKVVITGANGAVGQAILRWVARQPVSNPHTWIAAVRSDRAAGEIKALLGQRSSVVLISYDDPASMDAAFQGVSAVIHLAGILIEFPGSTYEKANIESTRSVVDAAKRNGISKIVLVSAVGASDATSNRYWLTKAQAEAIVRISGLPYTVVRAPLLLGPETEGSAALKRNASRMKVTLIRGGLHLQQPLHVNDLARAVMNATEPGVALNLTLNLVGPTSLPERKLVEIAAQVLGHAIHIRSFPKSVTALGISLRKFTGRPGLSHDALDVITDNTNINPMPAAQALGIELTGVEQMIKDSLG